MPDPVTANLLIGKFSNLSEKKVPLPPVAVSDWLLPTHIEALAGVMLNALGVGLTVTVTVPVLTQPEGPAAV